MKPCELLTTEHRLIEAMIAVIRTEITRIERGRQLNEFTINSIIDFMNFYADITHHGKEENILFNSLKKKHISKEDSDLMAELVQEHRFARKATDDVLKAEENYFKGQDTIGIIITVFNSLATLYPKHIQKEEQIFFPHTEKYFSDDEYAAMIKDFDDFDKTIVHKKYKSLVEQLKK